MLIEGSISVKSAIKNHKRQLICLYIDRNKKTKDFNYIRKLAKENELLIKEEDESTIQSLASGKSHGGVLLECGIRQYDEIKDGDIFYLDGIEDPFNLGYSLRTIYALGIKNVFLNNRDYTNMEAQVLKSSAGAYDSLNIALADEKTLMSLKEDGYNVYAMYRGNESKDVFRTKFINNSIYIFGGEKRGIKKEILALADEYLYISYGSDFRNSLNACAAVDVVATLVYKQKNDSIVR